MTVELPPQYTWGFVVGRFIHAIADTTDDEDRFPEARGANGTVTFTPSTRLRRHTEPPTSFILKESVTAEIVNGFLIDAEQQQGIYLISGPYRVDFRIQGGSIPSFFIEVTEGHTFTNPLDLVTAAPYVPSPGTPVTTLVVPAGMADDEVLAWRDGGLVWVPGAAQAEAAADRAAAIRDDVQEISGLTGEDQAVAFLVDSDGTTTGQVVRTLIQSETFNVKVFGAVGDGIADDTDAIQNAINAANSAGGGEVFFPGGTYNLTTTLTLWSMVRLRGIRGRTILKATGPQGFMINAVNRTNPSVSNLTLDGSDSTSLTGTLVFVSGGSGASFTDVVFIGNPPAGPVMLTLQNDTSDVIVHGCEFRSGRRGVVLLTGTKRVTIDSCRFDQLTEYGTYGVGDSTSQLEDINIHNCRFSQIIGGAPRHVIYFTSDEGTYHRRCKITNNDVVGNYASFTDGVGNADALAAYYLEDSVVSGNTVMGGGDIGIAMWRTRRTTCTGNVAAFNNVNGICLSAAEDCTVTGNVTFNNYQDFDGTLAPAPRGGIRLNADSARNVVSGNRSFDDQAVKTQDYGVVVSAGTQATLITGNHLSENLEGAISDLGTGTIAVSNFPDTTP